MTDPTNPIKTYRAYPLEPFHGGHPDDLLTNTENHRAFAIEHGIVDVLIKADSDAEAARLAGGVLLAERGVAPPTKSIGILLIGPDGLRRVWEFFPDTGRVGDLTPYCRFKNYERPKGQPEVAPKANPYTAMVAAFQATGVDPADLGGQGRLALAVVILTAYEEVTEQPDCTYGCACEHGILYLGGPDPETLGEKTAATLETLGAFWHQEYDSWAIHRG